MNPSRLQISIVALALSVAVLSLFGWSLIKTPESVRKTSVELESRLRDAGDNEFIDAIVTIRSNLPSDSLIGRSQTEVVAMLREYTTASQSELLEFLGGFGSQKVSSIEQFWLANCVSISATRDVIRAIACRYDVGAVRENGKNWKVQAFDLAPVVAEAPTWDHLELGGGYVARIRRRRRCHPMLGGLGRDAGGWCGFVCAANRQCRDGSVGDGGRSRQEHGFAGGRSSRVARRRRARRLRCMERPVHHVSRAANRCSRNETLDEWRGRSWGAGNVVCRPGGGRAGWEWGSDRGLQKHGHMVRDCSATDLRARDRSVGSERGYIVRRPRLWIPSPGLRRYGGG
jgi:hypothetical protein